MAKLIIFLLGLSIHPAISQTTHLTVGADTLSKLTKKLGSDITVNKQSSDIAAIEIKSNRLDDLHHIMHHDFKRCGGYEEHHNDTLAALKVESNLFDLSQNLLIADYQINQQNIVNNLVAQVSETEIGKTISKLSSYLNRYYLSPTGYESSRWILNKWRYLTRGRSDTEVKFFHHTFSQPSVIATFKGSKSDEVIVLGGHLDSIVNGSRGRAPGADDNASGIATLTEIIRVLSQNNYQPDRTLVFVGYAAEEVGLRGSRDVARTYQSMGKNVVGVIQFDMTLFNGSSNKINITADFTNTAQNSFLGNLVDEYVNVTWGYHTCGYACSDHAAWSELGYPASNPFEARFLTQNGAPVNEFNQNIHTTGDTLQVTNGSVEHVTHFVKLGVAYTVEMDKD